jgi:hypothetical protein
MFARDRLLQISFDVSSTVSRKPWLTDKTQTALTPTPLPERERAFEPRFLTEVPSPLVGEGI